MDRYSYYSRSARADKKKNKNSILKNISKKVTKIIKKIHLKIFKIKNIILKSFKKRYVLKNETEKKNARNVKKLNLKPLYMIKYPLGFASDDLKNDKEIVLKSIPKYGYATIC